MVFLKRLLIVLVTILFITGCTSINGNSVSKLETTIYKTNNHDELIIEEGFSYIKSIFTDKDTFYHASLLTMEYGTESTKELEEIVKTETNSYDVLYITFSFKTGNVEYESMKSNQLYNFETYLIKSYKDDIWHIYKMEEKK